MIRRWPLLQDPWRPLRHLPDPRVHVQSKMALQEYVSFVLLGDVAVEIRYSSLGLPRWLSGKEFACQAGDPASIHESGRSPGIGNGNAPQYSSLGNPMDRGVFAAYRIYRLNNSSSFRNTHSQFTLTTGCISGIVLYVTTSTLQLWNVIIFQRRSP